MIKKTVLAFMFVFGAFNTAPVLADDDDWAGLYQAIDPKDGSINYMSIIPKGNNQYELQVAVSDHAMCSAPAVIVASGRVENNKLFREQVILRCQGEQEVGHSDATYDLDEDNEIISLTAPLDGRVSTIIASAVTIERRGGLQA